MTIDADELQQLMAAADARQGDIESDGLIHVGKVELPKELPVFDEEFYKWKREYWAERIKKDNIKYMVAPMVDQSELAFRMMLHSHNAQLFFTPMIHAQLFVNNLTYRKTAFATAPEDRPLVVQFCANDPDIFLDACRLVEGFCDGVDLNLGCPQMVAKRGHYGSFLQEEPERVAEMISKVHKHCRLPLSVKIRVLESTEDTLSYAKLIEKSGASMLTVHGRLREMRGTNSGIADWNKIRLVKEALTIPVVANGNLQMPEDLAKCFEETNTVALMSAEGLLSNPYLFDGTIKPFYGVITEYLKFAVKYKAPQFAVRAHVFRICHHALSEFPEFRGLVAATGGPIENFQKVVDDLWAKFDGQVKSDDGLAFLDGSEQSLIEMVDKIPNYFAKPYVRPAQRTVEGQEPANDYRAKRRAELERISKETGLSFKQIRKRERRRITKKRPLAVQS